MAFLDNHPTALAQDVGEDGKKVEGGEPMTSSAASWLQSFCVLLAPMVSLENGIPPKVVQVGLHVVERDWGPMGFLDPPHLAIGKDLAFWFPQIWSLSSWVWFWFSRQLMAFLDNHPTALAQDVEEDGKPLERDAPATSSAASWLQSFCVLLAPMVSLENGNLHCSSTLPCGAHLGRSFF